MRAATECSGFCVSGGISCLVCVLRVVVVGEFESDRVCVDQFDSMFDVNGDDKACIFLNVAGWLLVLVKNGATVFIDDRVK